MSGLKENVINLSKPLSLTFNVNVRIFIRNFRSYRHSKLNNKKITKDMLLNFLNAVAIAGSITKRKFE